MEIILSDDDDNYEYHCEPWNDDDLACLLEGKWLNDKVRYDACALDCFHLQYVHQQIISAYISLVLKATPEQVCYTINFTLYMQAVHYRIL